MISEKQQPGQVILTLARRRPLYKFGLVVLFLGILRLLYIGHPSTYRIHYMLKPVDLEKYQRVDIMGYLNNGDSYSSACRDLRTQGTIRAKPAVNLTDDLLAIARSLHSHPMVDYTGMDRSQSFEKLVEHSWFQMGPSSAWVEEYGVYLTVTRVHFRPYGGDIPITFIRGQIHDENWNEMKDFVIDWDGKRVKFPLIFDIPVEYEKGGLWYGPEDPRIIVEQDVKHAEPVIVFNMMVDIKDKQSRVMHIHRPFSNETIRLHRADRHLSEFEREKNWMPFFNRNASSMAVAIDPTKPSDEIHFLHSTSPIQVIKCSLSQGWCEFVYQQYIDEKVHRRPKYEDALLRGTLNGGTNFVPLSLPHADPGIKAWVGFPRSHIEGGCEMAHYRPELLVMIGYRNKFHYGYLSDPLVFGTAAMSEDIVNDPCGAGRVFAPTSIPSWDYISDVMTITYYVADATTQVFRVNGIRRYLVDILSNATYILTRSNETDLEDLKWSYVSNSMWACTMDAGYRIAIEAGKVNGGHPVARPPGWSINGMKDPDSPEVQKETERQRLDALHAKIVPAGEKYEGDVIDLLEEERRIKEENRRKEEDDRRRREEEERRKKEEDTESKAKEGNSERGI